MKCCVDALVPLTCWKVLTYNCMCVCVLVAHSHFHQKLTYTPRSMWNFKFTSIDASTRRCCCAFAAINSRLRFFPPHNFPLRVCDFPFSSRDSRRRHCCGLFKWPDSLTTLFSHFDHSGKLLFQSCLSVSYLQHTYTYTHYLSLYMCMLTYAIAFFSASAGGSR